VSRRARRGSSRKRWGFPHDTETIHPLFSQPLRACPPDHPFPPACVCVYIHCVPSAPRSQSTWNLENRFTGWVDVPLTAAGVEEARRGGQALKKEGFVFDAAYKAETTAKHGEEKVTLWRRSYDVPPPAYDASHPYFVGNDRRYAGLPKGALPLTESTKTTGDRVLPFWLSTLKPAIASGKRLLVVAHGNSLRALVKDIDGFSNEAIVKLNIPTGVPLVYQFDEATWRPIPQEGRMDGLSGRYVGDLEQIAAEAKKVADQAKTKKK
jgi:2,3-bisphosphoglycerate-dependent phosphoglycerate mutase